MDRTYRQILIFFLLFMMLIAFYFWVLVMCYVGIVDLISTERIGLKDYISVVILIGWYIAPYVILIVLYIKKYINLFIFAILMIIWGSGASVILYLAMDTFFTKLSNPMGHSSPFG